MAVCPEKVAVCGFFGGHFGGMFGGHAVPPPQPCTVGQNGGLGGNEYFENFIQKIEKPAKSEKIV